MAICRALFSGLFVFAVVLLPLLACGSTEVSSDTIRIKGLGVEAFVAEDWQANNLHWVPDVRRPLIDPLPGTFRNIYAPSIVELTTDTWRIYYGGWDGVLTGNDRIYSMVTKGFRHFENRQVEIEHGSLQHICNVSALRLTDHRFALMCTGYPDSSGLNKPALFIGDGSNEWNGSRRPYSASTRDMITIEGYPHYSAADINGMNVIMKEGESHRLYFCDFRQFGKIYRASRSADRNFRYDGVCLQARMMVNDVKRVGTGTLTYVMGLHKNGSSLHYSLSKDGMSFDAPRLLFPSSDDSEKHIVSLGWVMAGDNDSGSHRIIGVLYGAGDKPTLDRNRIFARWLQSRAVIECADGRQIVSSGIVRS